MTRSDSLIIFSDLNKGPECSSNLEKSHNTHSLFLQSTDGFESSWVGVSPSSYAIYQKWIDQCIIKAGKD